MALIVSTILPTLTVNEKKMREEMDKEKSQISSTDMKFRIDTHANDEEKKIIKVF